MPSKKENSGCGCANIPISLLLVLIGVGYWGLTQLHPLNLRQLLPEIVSQVLPSPQTTPLTSNQPTSGSTTSLRNAASPHLVPINTPPHLAISPSTPVPPSPSSQTAWEKKAIRGIYLSRYQATNNADEQTIRERVRYYKSQGMNTIIHGVWGNGCTMYKSHVMQQTFGYKSCPNQFQDEWLNWLIDEAHKQGMQVHAYFEKGIKLDQNSPIFDLAVSKHWIVPGIDKTYSGIDHYVLDVQIPDVADFFRKISVEFVQKYPKIDAVQWDDYLGYYAGLPGKVDRTAQLTQFVRQMRTDLKKANPGVSFDLCHHNPYWGKRYFAADWQQWQIDRVFIQTYNDANFSQELQYAEHYAGVAITEKQLYRLKELVNNSKIKGVLVFPFSGKPDAVAAMVKQTTTRR